jgi:cyclophilin family peptidyl-prolyl cis-trans isomerase/HEAT repeat protein
MKRMILCFAIGLLVSGCAKNDDGERENMLKIADGRGEVVQMQPYLSHKSKKIQQKAIYLLGQMRDTLAVAMLMPFLQNASNALRVETIFALGQIGPARMADSLIAHWQDETDLEAKQAILEAVGKIGDSTHVGFLRNGLAEPTPILQQAAAVALGYLAYWKRIDVSPAVDDFAALLDDDLNEIRWRAAWALMRMADSSAYPYLLIASKDIDPRVRMQCARGLGRIGDASAADRLMQMAKDDPDWRVRASAAAAIGQLELNDYLSRLPLDDENEHVRLSAINALGIAVDRSFEKMAGSEQAAIIDFLEEKFNPDANRANHEITWRERAALANAYASALRDKALEKLRAQIDHPEPLFRARLVEAFAKTKSQEAINDLLSLFETGPMMVKIAVVRALRNFKGGVANRIALNAFNENDPVLTAQVTRFLAQDSVLGPKFEKQIVAAFENLRQPVDTEVASMIFDDLAKLKLQSAVPILEKALHDNDKAYRAAAANALKKLTGKSYLDDISAPAQPTEFSMAEINNLSSATATIETVHGNIVLSFYTDESPLTVLNFVRLAEKGFFDGLNFHRVVPNFVIQGGDPRGDGWGSPGYAIRSEFNRLPYKRGMVGMASAGPDTEGCQFFITHSPQPHLNGRYTLFARVKAGMEAVDAIQVGDRILKVTIEY